jgi:hypothetical protein
MIGLEGVCDRERGALQGAVIEAFGQETRATTSGITRDNQRSRSGNKCVGNDRQSIPMRRPANQWWLRIGMADSHAGPSIMPDSIGKGTELVTWLFPQLCIQAGNEGVVIGERPGSVACERRRAHEQASRRLGVGLERECAPRQFACLDGVAAKERLRTLGNEQSHCLGAVPIALTGDPLVKARSIADAEAFEKVASQ